MSERRYGRWAGNQKGDPEDPTRCIEVVCGRNRSVLTYQCSRKRGYGPGGLYCAQHAKRFCSECDRAGAYKGLCEGCWAYKEHQG